MVVYTEAAAEYSRSNTELKPRMCVFGDVVMQSSCRSVRPVWWFILRLQPSIVGATQN